MQIHEDIDFQKRSWVVQRIGWVFFAIALLLAGLGLFGNGLFSNAVAGQQDGALWLEYPRFARFEDEFPIIVHANGGSGNGGEIMIQLAWDYLEGFEVNTIFPDPDAQIRHTDQITYVFNANAMDSPFTAYFYLTPRKFGMQSGTVHLPDGQAVRFSQFIYP